jgi:hypothetical protein
MPAVDPRKFFDSTGIDFHATTFNTDGSTITFSATANLGSTVVGRSVSLSASGTVQLANDGDSVIGRLEVVDGDGQASVQDDGYCALPAGTSALVTLGAKIVGALLAGARGYIRAIPSPGAAYVQAEAVASANGRHLIVANTDTTAVVIRLD